MSNMSFHDVISHHVVMSCHVVTLETDPCVCPCQYSPTHVKDQNPCLSGKCQFQHSRPAQVTCRSHLSLARKPQNQAKHSATPPFLPASMWGMTCQTFHFMMSCHAMSSCHVIMLETDPCVCPCQYSPTHVKDQNPCLCVKCPFQHLAPTHVASKTSKSGFKTPEMRPNQVLRPFSARKHVGDDMLNMSFHDVMSRHVMSCRHVRD